MDWKTMLGYVSGSVDEKLLLRNGVVSKNTNELKTGCRDVSE